MGNSNIPELFKGKNIFLLLLFFQQGDLKRNFDIKRFTNELFFRIFIKIVFFLAILYSKSHCVIVKFEIRKKRDVRYSELLLLYDTIGLSYVIISRSE